MNQFSNINNACFIEDDVDFKISIKNLILLIVYIYP